MGDPGVEQKYSGYKKVVSPWIPSVEKLRDRIERESKMKVNNAILNRYRNGDDYISWHSDAAGAGSHNTVFALSLGGPRDFRFRLRKDHALSSTYSIGSGDMMIMAPQCNELFEHTVPKRASAHERISITFRYI